MTGSELARRRKQLGYNQDRFIRELGVGSRQTLSSWENADDIPRLVVLALYALERCPECQETVGNRIPVRDERAYFSGLNPRGTAADEQ